MTHPLDSEARDGLRQFGSPGPASEVTEAMLEAAYREYGAWDKIDLDDLFHKIYVAMERAAKPSSR